MKSNRTGEASTKMKSYGNPPYNKALLSDKFSAALQTGRRAGNPPLSSGC